MVQVIETVDVREFFSTVADAVPVPVAENLFIPDAWTKIFARGLEKICQNDIDTPRRTFLEVGVGTGIVMTGLFHSPFGPSRYIGTDVCEKAVAAAGELVNHHKLTNYTVAQSDLLKAFSADDLRDVDHIVACIPQVPAPAGKKLGDADNFSHYYLANGSRWDEFGLGLNAKLLDQAHTKAPHAKVTLNLAGRPGIDHLTELFERHGYEPTISHSEVVPQHPGTSLQSLVEREANTDHQFEFYADHKGKESITAFDAHNRKLQGRTPFHKVYVISGTPSGVK